MVALNQFVRKEDSDWGQRDYLVCLLLACCLASCPQIIDWKSFSNQNCLWFLCIHLMATFLYSALALVNLAKEWPYFTVTTFYHSSFQKFNYGQAQKRLIIVHQINSKLQHLPLHYYLELLDLDQMDHLRWLPREDYWVGTQLSSYLSVSDRIAGSWTFWIGINHLPYRKIHPSSLAPYSCVQPNLVIFPLLHHLKTCYWSKT